MYISPMRLWSTVVSHDVEPASPPVGAIRLDALDVDGHLGAASLRQVLGVRDERLDLVVGPVPADRRHLALTVAEQGRQAAHVAEQWVAAERRPDVGVVEPMARLAGRPLLLAELRPGRVRVCGLR